MPGANGRPAEMPGQNLPVSPVWKVFVNHGPPRWGQDRPRAGIAQPYGSDGKIEMAANAAEMDGAGEAPAAKKRSLPKRPLLIGALVVVLGIGAGAGYFAFQRGKSVDAEKAAMKKKNVFFDLPEMTANLASAPGQERPVFLKLKVALEVEDQKMIAEIQPLMPRIVDNFQVFLRELRPQDLEGSAGIYRLKEELVRRINAAVYPARVEAILFKDVLVQ